MQVKDLSNGKQVTSDKKNTGFSCHLSPVTCHFLSFVCLWLIFALPSFAQTVSGIVVDEKNAPIANAVVSFSNNSQTVTAVDGKFSLATTGTLNLRLKISASGFADFEQLLKATDFQSELKIVLKPANLREEVTVSVTKTESRLSETPASIVVLNRENLNATAAQTVDEALRQVAGFTLFRRSSSKTANPTTQGANLRGIGGSGAARTAVLFDGVSLNDAFGGWTYWTRIPPIAIEQAEILRGGASSIYGNAALSGAVNLETSRSETPILRFQTSGGTQKTFDGSIFTAYGKRGWKIDLAAEAFQTGGYIPVATKERGIVDTKANSRRQNALLTIERRFNENLRIFARGNLFAERRDNGTSLTGNRTYFRQTVFGTNFNREKFGTFQFRSAIENQIYDQTFSAISNNRNTETRSRIQRVPSQAANASLFWTKSFGNHAASALIELKQVRGFSDESVFANNRVTTLIGAGGKEQTFRFFAQDFWRINAKLNLNFGAGFDVWENKNALSTTRNVALNQTMVSSFPSRRQRSFSPRIGAIYQINQNFAVLGSYTKSFRAPTLNELYRAFRVGNVLTLANENLIAERADTFETGLNFTGFERKLTVRGNVFRTEISNPVANITLNFTPNLITRQRQNVGKTRALGLEIDAEFTPLKNLRLSASFLAVDSRITDFPVNPLLLDKFLPQIPRRQITFQAFYRPTAKLAFSMQGRISDAQFEDDLNSLRLRPLATFDTLISYRFFKKAEIFTALENIFNARYDIGLTPNRNISAPRFVRVGLRY